MAYQDVGPEEWAKVWAAVREIADPSPDDHILIGGVAVYLHAKEFGEFAPEYTHDADMYVSVVALTDIRDRYEVSVNRRLSKSEVRIGDIDVDLYVERRHELRLDYSVLALAANEIDGVRVAALEHLLLLKLDAFAQRGASSHGDKDRRDLAKMLVMLETTAPSLVLAQVTDKDLTLLDKVLGSDVFMEVAAQNAHKAMHLRRRATAFVDAVKERVR